MLRKLSWAVSKGMGISKIQRTYSSISHFRTTETNPTLLNDSHLGRFYTVEPDAFKTIYGASDKGVGLPSIFKVQCTTFRETSFLVRKQFLDIKRCIESYDLSLPVLKYVLHGPPGVGKTITLATLAHYGYSKSYVLVHFPWVPTWTRFAKETVPSTTRSGYFDHTVDSVVWLTFFRHQNSKLLTQNDLTTANEYAWNQREVTPAGSHLTEIIEHGIARPIHASECIYALMTELKILSNQRKCKAMVLIDGVNALFHDPRKIKRSDKTEVPHQNVTVYEGLKQFFKNDWLVFLNATLPPRTLKEAISKFFKTERDNLLSTGGVVITTVDKLAVASDLRESNFPRYLLGKDGWEQLDPFIPVQVDKYSSQEVQTTIDYFIDRKWLQHPLAGTKEARQELEAISVRNPYTLMNLCNAR